MLSFVNKVSPSTIESPVSYLGVPVPGNGRHAMFSPGFVSILWLEKFAKSSAVSAQHY
jgi:hypothetical protein